MSQQTLTIGYDVSSIFGRNGIARYSRELLLEILKRNLVTLHMVGTKNQMPEMCDLFSDGLPSGTDLTMTHERALGAPLRRLVRLWKAREIKHRFDHDDVVHYLGPQKIFARHYRAISTIHDLIPLYDEFAVDSGLRYRFPKMIEQQLRQSSAVVCPSQWVADTIRERFTWFKGPVTVTPLGAGKQFTPTVMSAEQRQRFQISERYVVFVGRIDVARKNLDMILKAWMSIPLSIRSETQFLVITDRSAAAIKGFLASHGLSIDGSVRFLTSVSTSDLVPILSNAQAMVFASQAEGFGLPILEAMQCGCPVVTSNKTSMPEVGGDAALYVDPRDLEQVRVAITRILTDGDLRTDLRRRGLERSNEFSWSKTADATLRAYETCPAR